GRYLRQSILMLFSDDRGTIPTSVAQSRLAEIPRSKYAGESTWIRSAMFIRGATESFLVAQPILQWVELDGARIDTDEHMHRIAGLSNGSSNAIGPLTFDEP